MLCKVRIEEMRLVVWGREWGVAEGRLEAHLKTESNPQMRVLATQIMTELYNTVTDFQRLQEKYGLVDQGAVEAKAAKAKEGGGEGTESPSPTLSRKGSELGHTRRNSKNGLETARSWRKEFTLRTRWVIGGHTLSVSFLSVKKSLPRKTNHHIR